MWVQRDLNTAGFVCASSLISSTVTVRATLSFSTGTGTRCRWWRWRAQSKAALVHLNACLRHPGDIIIRGTSRVSCMFTGGWCADSACTAISSQCGEGARLIRLSHSQNRQGSFFRLWSRLVGGPALVVWYIDEVHLFTRAHWALYPRAPKEDSFT